MSYKIEQIMSNEFPEKLLRISNPPKKLYAIGNIELLYKDSFGIVGTRRITAYGKNMCEEFSKEFALRDIPIVSGMAVGVDEFAHRTALSYDGGTIAVLGSGFNYVYPEENIDLFRQIIENNGLILSEYSEDIRKSSDKFPKRNRIIAALSEGILVIEASKKSGSSITAKLANSYGKNVYAVPGRLGDKMSVGTNNLIKEYANLSTSADEIINDYPQFSIKKRKSADRKVQNMSLDVQNFKDSWKKVIFCLSKDMKTVEEIQIETNIDIRKLLETLTEMEIMGIITKNSKMEYEILNKGENKF